jgi:hypothetical protein
MRPDYRSILWRNHGFHPDIDRWLDYARIHGFREVKATPVPNCPDCGHSSDRVLGQYIHYSTLLRLRECVCGLIWSDVVIDPAVIADHFERGYKDETYFQRQRGPIFRQLTGLIDKLTPQGGSVIDIGGGKGHLMHEARQRRPDLSVSLVDISTESVAHCQQHFGITASTGSILEVTGRYNTVVLSDVLYYEDNIREAWDALSRIADTVIIRGPNKLEWIRASTTGDPMQSSVRHFNPEHRFILSQQYVESSLRRVGFTSVKTIPARALKTRTSPLVDLYSALMYGLTGKVKSPSMVTIARRA